MEIINNYNESLDNEITSKDIINKISKIDLNDKKIIESVNIYLAKLLKKNYINDKEKEWIVKYLVNKYATKYELKINVVACSPNEFVMKTQTSDPIYKDLFNKNKAIHRPKNAHCAARIYINLQNNKGPLEIMKTVLHEIRHVLIEDLNDHRFVWKRRDYNYLKQQYLKNVEPAIYQKYYEYFDMEIDAEIMGFEYLKEEMQNPVYQHYFKSMNDYYHYLKELDASKIGQINLINDLKYDQLRIKFDEIYKDSGNRLLAKTKFEDNFFVIEYNDKGIRWSISELLDRRLELINKVCNNGGYIDNHSTKSFKALERKEFLALYNELIYRSITSLKPSELKEIANDIKYNDLKIVEKAIMQETHNLVSRMENNLNYINELKKLNNYNKKDLTLFLNNHQYLKSLYTSSMEYQIIVNESLEHKFVKKMKVPK